jgi:hypothetical protein
MVYAVLWKAHTVLAYFFPDLHRPLPPSMMPKPMNAIRFTSVSPVRTMHRCYAPFPAIRPLAPGAGTLGS